MADPAACDTGCEPAELKTELKRLQARREELETILQRNTEYLRSTPVGEHGRLLDAEGFPRGDVDHYAVRQARHDIAVATTDIKWVMESIRLKMIELHEATRSCSMEAMQASGAAAAASADASESGGAGRKKMAEALMQQAQMRREMPFVRVVTVAPRSPAENAGLLTGDLVTRFGGLRKEEFDREGAALAALAARVVEGEITSVVVRRQAAAGNPRGEGAEELVECPLVPRRWAGPGLVGCVFDTVLS